MIIAAETAGASDNNTVQLLAAARAGWSRLASGWPPAPPR